MGTETTSSSNSDCPEPARPHVTDPKTTTDLTFSAHCTYPLTVTPHFPDMNLAGLPALWRPPWRRESAVLPVLASLKRIPFLSPRHPSLCLWILSAASGRTWSVSGPAERGALAPLRPSCKRDSASPSNRNFAFQVHGTKCGS